MATYTIPYSFATQPRKACAVLLAFAVHRAPWGKTVPSNGVSMTSGQLRITITPDLTQAEVDHLMSAGTSEE